MSQCHHYNINSVIYQNLDELDFERGIWAADINELQQISVPLMMLETAQNNDISRVLKLIKKGVNLNSTDKAGYTALHYASRNGHFEMCKLLLSNNADVNLLTHAGKASSLHRSASAGHLDIFKILLERGAKIDLKDSDGKTVLHRATEADHEGIVKMILEVDPGLAGQRDNRGELAIHLAKSNIIRTLLGRMTMGDETPVSSLVLPVLIRPILSQMERRDVAAIQTLRAAISKVESSYPGFTYDLVVGIMRRGDLSINMNESILRLQGSVSDTDVAEYRLTRSEDAFQELNKKSASLKKILSRIPDEISDRKTFLETIKEIASAIKKLLDTVSELSEYLPGTTGKQALEQKKREFVKYSKRFSNTLKEFFREGQPNIVYVSALYLIQQTNQIMLTIKNKCE